MDENTAKHVLCSFQYLVNNCVLLPGYFVITEMRCVLISEWAENDPELLNFIKKKKNATIFSSGEYTVVAKIGSDPDINGNYTDTKELLLNDLLQEYMVKILAKPI